MSWINDLVQKLNPAHGNIVSTQGGNIYTDYSSHKRAADAYDDIEVVNRGINLIADLSAELQFDIGDRIHGLATETIRIKKLEGLLNHAPNPYQSADTFKRTCFVDFLVDGNIFIYYDGAHLYHLPAKSVEIVADKKEFVKEYKYDSVVFKATEVIHIRDNSADSIFRGTSRLESAYGSIDRLSKMLKFQTNFFKNGAVPGLILKSPNVLSNKMKQRLLDSWAQKYNPENGGRRPVVLDGDLDIKPMVDSTFKDLDFENAVQEHEIRILKAIGVPPILLDGGNNANIKPNMRLLYQTSIIPLVAKFSAAMRKHFGYNISPITETVSALLPEVKDQAAYLATLVNSGIMTPNEARSQLRLEALDGGDDRQIPANIAGSAANPSEGGKPDEGEEGKSVLDLSSRIRN
jgi:HK97 family phage portal protein